LIFILKDLYILYNIFCWLILLFFLTFLQIFFVDLYFFSSLHSLQIFFVDLYFFSSLHSLQIFFVWLLLLLFLTFLKIYFLDPLWLLWTWIMYFLKLEVMNCLKLSKVNSEMKYFFVKILCLVDFVSAMKYFFVKILCLIIDFNRFFSKPLKLILKAKSKIFKQNKK
jgi:hypothetical protein